MHEVQLQQKLCTNVVQMRLPDNDPKVAGPGIPLVEHILVPVEQDLNSASVVSNLARHSRSPVRPWCAQTCMFECAVALFPG